MGRVMMESSAPASSATCARARHHPIGPSVGEVASVGDIFGARHGTKGGVQAGDLAPKRRGWGQTPGAPYGSNRPKGSDPHRYIRIESFAGGRTPPGDSDRMAPF